MSNFESNGQQKARYSSNNIKMTKYFLSIALCTYNGERYLQEQLNSIAWQNRLPDELVICDDLSCDNTASVVKSFATKVDFPVHFLVNDKNIGSTKNFEKAISLCNGDIIILADQDDIWHPEKLMMIENSFLSSPEVGLVFSDAEIVDNNLSELQYNLWQSIDFNQWEQRYFLKKDKNYIFNFLVKKNVVTGATAAFLSKYKDIILPIPEIWVHDAWIALIISGIANFSLIQKSLIKYRQHSHQQIGASKKSYAEIIDKIKQEKSNSYALNYTRFELLSEQIIKNKDLYSPQMISRLESKIYHLAMRASIREKSRLYRIIPILREIITFRYHHFSSNWKSIFKDLLISNNTHL